MTPQVVPCHWRNSGPYKLASDSYATTPAQCGCQQNLGMDCTQRVRPQFRQWFFRALCIGILNVQLQTQDKCSWARKRELSAVVIGGVLEGRGMTLHVLGGLATGGKTSQACEA